jgi:hypothetical protein
MKKAGDLLSSFFKERFDNRLLQKAKEYGELYASWTSVIEEAERDKRKKITAAAAHSRIVELERFVLLVEADHPGWIQILQTKQSRLLELIRRRFPNLTITGISFRLSRSPLSANLEKSLEKGNPRDGTTEKSGRAIFRTGENENPEFPNEFEKDKGSYYVDPFKKIDDDDFKDSLKRLEKSILSRNKIMKRKKS